MNKTIWLCWFQGWETAPDIVKLCAESWEFHNPEWKIVKLDDNNIGDYVDITGIIPGKNMKKLPAAYSDVLRIALLKDHGGVWADATCFCNKPLDSWLEEHMSDSWCYYRQDSHIASWFIAADKGSYLINKWYNVVVSYWKDRLAGRDRMKGEYRWFHFLFVETCKKDEKFNELFKSWKRVDCTSFSPGFSPPPTKEHPHYSRGLTAHYFTPYPKYLNEVLTPPVKERIDSKVDAMYKLSHKYNIDWNKKGTSLKYLIKSIDIDLIIDS